MQLTADQATLVAQFRAQVQARVQKSPLVTSVAPADREDGSTLATRFQVAPRIWLEAVIRPRLPQLRAGILTDDRWTNEDLEDKIEESGDTMEEFVELGFQEAGLEWPKPVVEHYRDQGVYFCFATAIPLQTLDELRKPELLDKFCRMLEGYAMSFDPAIRKANLPGDTG